MSGHLPEPIFDVAQLAHVELLTPKPDETLWFFKDLLGLRRRCGKGSPSISRGYEESSHHSLKVTQAPERRRSCVKLRPSAGSCPSCLPTSLAVYAGSRARDAK